MSKFGLGKGFDALIPTDLVDENFDPTATQDGKISDLRVIAISEISPDSEQPRQNFDEEHLKTLAESVKEHGILQPIVVVPKNGKFEIVAGERRYRAAKIAKLKKVPAIIRTLSAQHKLELSIIENVQRADLNPLETATAYLKLKNQFNLTDAEIATRVGKAISTISNQMRLLSLPEFVKSALISGEITEGHARQILALAAAGGDEKLQKQLFDLIIKENWSVRKTEQFIIGFKKGDNSSKKSERSASARRAVMSETDFTRELSKKLNLKSTQITQKTTARGGEIIIKFTDDKELEKIKSRFL